MTGTDLVHIFLHFVLALLHSNSLSLIVSPTSEGKPVSSIVPRSHARYNELP